MLLKRTSISALSIDFTLRKDAMTSVVVQAVPLQQKVQWPEVLIQKGPHSELEPRPGLAL